MKGWFPIDVLSIIPFDILFNQGDGGGRYNNLARVARIGRLYKLVKLTKLIRILKVMKEQNKILKYINKGLNIQSGYDRMIFFVFIFILLCHIATCLWIMTATIMSEEETHDGKKYKGTWLSPWEKSYSSDSAFYCISFYWTITTITTVGYGDISATNLSEMIFASIMMVIGVISFSFANGALTSILATSDSENGNFNSKVEILEKAKKKYHIPDTLYRRTKKSIKYAIQNDQEDLYNFVQELPHHIQNEMS